jgi:hypothetical protein
MVAAQDFQDPCWGITLASSNGPQAEALLPQCSHLHAHVWSALRPPEDLALRSRMRYACPHPVGNDRTLKLSERGDDMEKQLP